MVFEQKTIKQGRKLIDSLRAFERLSPEGRDILAESAIVQKIRLDQYLWQYGDSSEYFACIASGVIEISRPTPLGAENLMGIFGPGDFIGLSAFLKRTPFPGFSKAISPDTTVLKFYLRNQTQKSGTKYEEIMTWIREMFLLHEQILRDKIDILTAGSIENRILEFLLHLRRRFGVIEGRVKCTIPIAISKTQVAKIIDARTETVFRTLAAWKKMNLIDWETQKIIVPNFEFLELHVHKQLNKK